MPVVSGPHFPQPASIPIAGGPDQNYRCLPQARYHKCQTLGFKNGLRVERKPVQAIGGDRLIQDLLIAVPEGDKYRRDGTEGTGQLG